MRALKYLVAVSLAFLITGCGSEGGAQSKKGRHGAEQQKTPQEEKLAKIMRRVNYNHDQAYQGLNSYEANVMTSRMDIMYTQMKQRMPVEFLPKERPTIKKYWSRDYLNPVIVPGNSDKFPFMQQIVNRLADYNADAENSFFLPDLGAAKRATLLGATYKTVTKEKKDGQKFFKVLFEFAPSMITPKNTVIINFFQHDLSNLGGSVSQLELWVGAKSYTIDYAKVHFISKPDLKENIVDISIKHQLFGKVLLPVEITALSNEGLFHTTFKVDYTQVDGYWLYERFTRIDELQKGHGGTQIIRFSDYKVNAPAPEGTWLKRKKVAAK